MRSEMPSFPDSIEGPQILASEVGEAIRRMKSNKAAGPDGIVTEMVVALEDFGIKKLTEVINQIYKDGQFPEDLSKSII